MRVPPRFREGREDLLAATLLDAARAYRRPPSTRARIAKALGLPIAVSVAAPAVAAASSFAAKMVVIVSAATIATGGGVVAYRIHTEREARRAVVTRAAPVADAGVRRAPPSFARPTLAPVMSPRPEERPTTMASAKATPAIAAAALSLQHTRLQRLPAPRAVEPAPRANETAVAPAPAPAAVAMAVPAPAMKPAPPAPPVSPSPFAPVVRASVPAASLATASSSIPSRPVANIAPAPQQVPLTREIELLDAAERAERRGDHGAALVTLDEYVRAFPVGAMLAESKVLRIAALLGRGDRAAAQDLGRAFLARYAPSPLGARVRSMLPELSNPKKELP
jgi:hypothetical protein